MRRVITLKDLLQNSLDRLYCSEEQYRLQLKRILEKLAPGPFRKAVIAYQQVKLRNKERLASLVDTGTKRKHLAIRKRERYRLLEYRGTEQRVADAILVHMLQQFNQFSITGYSAAASYARNLELSVVEKVLQYSLLEERKMEIRLFELAEKAINPTAIFH